MANKNCLGEESFCGTSNYPTELANELYILARKDFLTYKFLTRGRLTDIKLLSVSHELVLFH